MPSHPRRSRLRRGLLAALVAASVAVPVSGAARPTAVPAPAPAVHGPLRTAAPEALAERYAATRADIGAAERAAARHGDRKRAAALHELAGPARRFLTFDGRDGGRSVEVFGDLSHAERIAVLVPGAGIDIDHYWRLRNGARALRKELGGRSAVVAWLGYRTPTTVSPTSITSARAIEAAPELTRFSRELTRLRPTARTTLLCHSYGSVVCARAAHGLRVSGIVLYGSPGTGYRNTAALHTPATVWAGRGSGDWIADVPHMELRLPFADIGFGTDPVSPGFGAKSFAAGSGGHSDYLNTGSEPLRNIARIVAGAAGSAEPTGERHA
ncbi:alpha/beta hydrolase [Streptomyces sp. NBC_00893]|uniref:alpha/beta hydrolase n=1 Tax=Streptomyces sp. NBC_00893 TaxID=2975862 RepID=UPI00225BCD9E|nr:alpha/beta hydrolase [Streptomyces sp. NBC_00893]MCX4849721.1 alpha/beta hydrolase family protein [Streptomyces sp. NBC_00893]